MALETDSVGMVPPQNLDAEMAVLGAILMAPEALSQIVTFLKPEHFYRKGHGRIYEAAISLYERNEPVDLVTVTEGLRKAGDLEEVGGVELLNALMDSVAGPSNVDYHAKIVRDKALLRSVIAASTKMMKECYESDARVEDILDRTQQILFGLTESREERGVTPLKNLMLDAYELVDKAAANKGGVTGVASGLADLDERTTGLQAGQLIIVAGRPSMGKSSLAITVAMNVSINEKLPVLIFSVEMPKEMVVLRMLCSQAKVPMRKVRAGRLSDQDYERMSRMAGILSQVPVYVDDTPGLSLLELRAKARRLKIEQPDLALIVVDYLQLMEVRRRIESRQQEIAEISRGLKGVARELQVPVIAVSQLSRAVEQRHGEHRPQLSDLRDSGAIEQDGDLIVFIYRKEHYQEGEDEGIAELIIGKQRNGPTGSFKVSFLKEHMLFKDLTTEYVDVSPESPF